MSSCPKKQQKRNPAPSKAWVHWPNDSEGSSTITLTRNTNDLCDQIPLIQVRYCRGFICCARKIAERIRAWALRPLYPHPPYRVSHKALKASWSRCLLTPRRQLDRDACPCLTRKKTKARAATFWLPAPSKRGHVWHWQKLCFSHSTLGLDFCSILYYLWDVGNVTLLLCASLFSPL